MGEIISYIGKGYWMTEKGAKSISKDYKVKIEPVKHKKGYRLAIVLHRR